MTQFQRNLLCVLVFAIIAISCTDGSISKKQIQIAQVALAQPLANNTSDSQSFSEIITPVPGWIKNNTSSWSHGKIGDSQFILGVRYLVANNFMTIPHQYVDSSLEKPIPIWIKGVATWWTDGNISDYEFISNIQYLINHGEIKIGPDENQTLSQDSRLLENNFPKGKIKVDNVTLDVQIADTSDRMIEGLQFQQSLPYTQGMIFIFGEPQMVAMWMKDMQFPLDMIWFNNDGNVIHIEKDLPPCNDNLPCRVYDGGRQDTKYVLEVTAGFVDKFNVTEKSKLSILGHT